MHVCRPCNSAGGVGVQPAAELRHVERHIYKAHVCGALRACSNPTLTPTDFSSRALGSQRVHAACAATATAPSRRPTPRPDPHTSPLYRLAGRVGVQPAAEFRHVQRHRHDIHVPRALPPGLEPPGLWSAPSACTLLAPPLPPLLPRRPAPSLVRISRPLLSNQFREQTPCPTPIDCRFVARGRATRPWPLLAMAQAGVRGPARSIVNGPGIEEGGEV